MADSKPRPFAAMLKARREFLNKSRAELAVELGCTERAIAAWETGQNQIGLADFHRVARALEFTEGEIAEAVRLAAVQHAGVDDAPPAQQAS